MRMELYSVYDKTVQAFLPPFYVRTRGEAIRSFSESCNDPASMFSKYPSDYDLVFCGSFDDQNCSIEPVSPVRVISAFEVVKEREVVLPPDAEIARRR